MKLHLIHRVSKILPSPVFPKPFGHVEERALVYSYSPASTFLALANLSGFCFVFVFKPGS